MHGQRAEAVQEPSTSTEEDCSNCRDFQKGRWAKGGFGGMHLSRWATWRWYRRSWFTISGKDFGMVPYIFTNGRDWAVLGSGIGIARHEVKFVNLCVCSFIYFSSSGSRLLSSVEVDSLKAHLRACLLYTTGRPFRRGWQEDYTEFCSRTSKAEALENKAFTKANTKKGQSKRWKAVGR